MPPVSFYSCSNVVWVLSYFSCLLHIDGCNWLHVTWSITFMTFMRYHIRIQGAKGAKGASFSIVTYFTYCKLQWSSWLLQLDVVYYYLDIFLSFCYNYKFHFYNAQIVCSVKGKYISIYNKDLTFAWLIKIRYEYVPIQT